MKIHPVAYPAELIDVVELLRADVDAWKIRQAAPRRIGPRNRSSASDPAFVDADTALAYLRRMVQSGLEP